MVESAARVSRLAMGVWRRYLSRLTQRAVSINGEAGLLMLLDDRPACVLSIDTDGERILGVYVVLNPDKLKGITL
jgi:RNA polymerase sigma-70 factor (ECF subfamily)